MISRDDLEYLFASWKEQYGIQWVGHTGTPYMVVPGTPPPRREMLRHLFNTLVEEYQFTLKDFSGSIKNQIEDTCVWPEWKNKSKLVQWRKNVRADIDKVLAETFPKKFVEKEFVPKQVEVYENTNENSTADLTVGEQIDPAHNFDDSLNEGESEISRPLDRSIFLEATPNFEVDLEFLKILEGEDNG